MNTEEQQQYIPWTWSTEEVRVINKQETEDNIVVTFEVIDKSEDK